MRKLILLLLGAVLVASGCTKSPSKATPSPEEATPEATPEVTPVATLGTFEISGTVKIVLTAPSMTATSSSASPNAGTLATSTPLESASPGTSTGATAGKPGGFVVGLMSVSDAVSACGFKVGDTIPVFFTATTTFDPATIPSAKTFPTNLANQKVTASGSLQQVTGAPCVFVADSIVVGKGAAASATPSGTRKPTATPKRTTSPTPTHSPSASASPTPTATSAATPTPTP